MAHSATNSAGILRLHEEDFDEYRGIVTLCEYDRNGGAELSVDIAEAFGGWEDEPDERKIYGLIRRAIREEFGDRAVLVDFHGDEITDEWIEANCEEVER